VLKATNYSQFTEDSKQLEARLRSQALAHVRGVELQPNSTEIILGCFWFCPDFTWKGWFDDGEAKSRCFVSWAEQKLGGLGAWWSRMVMEQEAEDAE